jgi:hypothetical protein
MRFVPLKTPPYMVTDLELLGRRLCISQRFVDRVKSTFMGGTPESVDRFTEIMTQILDDVERVGDEDPRASRLRITCPASGFVTLAYLALRDGLPIVFLDSEVQ